MGELNKIRRTGNFFPVSFSDILRIAIFIESYACAWLIMRWCGEDIRFNTVKEISALIFAPLIVTWAKFQDMLTRDQWKMWLEMGLFLAIWSKISQLSFQVQASADPFTAKPYFLVALLAYAAIRLGQRGVTVALIVLSIIAITSEAIRTGPSPLGGYTLNDRLLLLQVFISCIAITGFILSASYSESRSAERSSREGHSRIRALGDNLPNGSTCTLKRELNVKLGS